MNKRKHCNGTISGQADGAALTAKLETVIEQLHKAIAPISGREQVGIICEQITTLRGIAADIAKGGVSNG